MKMWILLVILGVLFFLLASSLMINQSDSLGPQISNRQTTIFDPGRPSITYEVFKPAAFLLEDIYFFSRALVEFFRPSSLQEFMCDIAPSRLERVPTQLLRNTMKACYIIQELPPQPVDNPDVLVE